MIQGKLLERDLYNHMICCVYDTGNKLVDLIVRESVKRKLYSLFLLTFITVWGASSQTRHPILDQFLVFESGQKVHIVATISAGFTCNGINYYRALPGQEFEKIGDVSGICGSPDFAVQYTFIDEAPPLNTQLRYQVDFGGFGNTETVSIEVIDFGDKRYQLRPNPLKDEGTLLLENRTGELLQVELYNMQGQLVSVQETRERSLPMNMSRLSAGYYFMLIRRADRSIFAQGSILKL